MPFSRSFEVSLLEEWDEANPGNAVRTLFDRWCLPGEKATGETTLRLGLRNGYLNFYIKGQSVGKLSVGGKGPRLSVHENYVMGSQLQGTGCKNAHGQNYQVCDAKTLAEPKTGDLIRGWIEKAESFAKREKRFVDDLIAANPGVIDMEMALPAGVCPDGKRVAPRMDLVVAQRAGSPPLSIAFWEAKCPNNRDLSPRAVKPKVLKQVETYVEWLKGDRIEEVQKAYRCTAIRLLALHRLFRGSSTSTPESILIWQALAKLDAPAVIVRPGIVIGNYCPEGFTESSTNIPISQAAVRFGKNGHRKKIEDEGYRVHEVGPGYGEHLLPLLASDSEPA